MFKSMLFAPGFLLITALAVHSADAIGFRETEIDQGGTRPLHISMWYPADDDDKTEVVGENRAFLGVPAIRDAKPASMERPLVVLSHGYSGSWRNLNWLAIELARQGYIVAAPDHPGNTTPFNMDPVQSESLWERPHDLSRVIDLLEGDSTLAGKIDAGRIAAIGHSLGEWTVTALAGARFDTKRFEKDCQSNTSPRACALNNRALERAGQAQRVDHRSLDEQRAETTAKAEEARAANDNVRAKVLDFEAAKLDRDPEPKIGAIAMALERRGEPSERGQLWRAVVARNLDRFSAWIALQRARLDALWGRFERAMVRSEEREDETRQGGQEQKPAEQSGFTPEQRDRLLGRNRGPAGKARPERDDKER